MFQGMFGSSSDNSSDTEFVGGYNAEEGVYYAKGTYDNAIEYNNEIMCIINEADDNMALLNDAMEAQDYARAEAVRESFRAHVAELTTKVEEFGPYKTDRFLLDAAKAYFAGLDAVLAEEYVKLISLRSSGGADSDEAKMLLGTINKKLADTANEFNKKSDIFLQGFDEIGEEFDTNFENPFANITQDPEDENHAAIHGISLEDYAGAAYALANGKSEAEVCRILGIEKPVWDEVNALWVERMQKDMSVIALYGQYFAAGDTNAKFSNSASGAEETAPQNTSDMSPLDRIKNDEYFYYELSGARQAAYDMGLDGAAWIEKTYGIGLSDFQNVAMHWTSKSIANIPRMIAYQEEKRQEYAKKFATEAPNIADDIEY